MMIGEIRHKSIDNTSVNLLNTQFQPLSFDSHISNVADLIESQSNGYICVSNVHMTVEGFQSKAFAKVLAASKYTVPDGMPLVWFARYQGYKKCERVAGYDLMIRLCSLAEERGWRMCFYGSTAACLSRIHQNLLEAYPNLKLPLMIAPPFGDVPRSILNQHISIINKSNIDFVFVSLGCPKQEMWMHANHLDIDSLLLGVGGAFPLLAGDQKRAPAVMRQLGLEWLFRLLLEPRRMWRRYLVTNSLFIYFLIKKYLGK